VARSPAVDRSGCPPVAHRSGSPPVAHRSGSPPVAHRSGSPPIAHRSGRPKDIARREAIIKAARTLFASQPFDLVTMEAVANHAHVSKMTVYSHFHDKETLFATIVLATSDQMIRSLSDPAETGGLRERLIAVGTVVLGVILGSDICTMAHTLPPAFRANKALADRFYAAGPGRVRTALAAIIASAAKNG
jgi:TetR/AcrR family transcriptional repressor of mexJK operon